MIRVITLVSLVSQYASASLINYNPAPPAGTSSVAATISGPNSNYAAAPPAGTSSVAANISGPNSNYAPAPPASTSKVAAPTGLPPPPDSPPKKCMPAAYAPAAPTSAPVAPLVPVAPDAPESPPQTAQEAPAIDDAPAPVPQQIHPEDLTWIEEPPQPPAEKAAPPPPPSGGGIVCTGPNSILYGPVCNYHSERAKLSGYKDQMLMVHNCVRRNLAAVTGTRIPDLTYSQDVENIATQIGIDHNSQICENEHHTPKGYGQNLDWFSWSIGKGGNPNDFEKASLDWSMGDDYSRYPSVTYAPENECSNYFKRHVSNLGSLNEWGHFSQVAWPTTKELGCSLVSCGNGMNVVCEYFPGGNIVRSNGGAAVLDLIHEASL